MMPRASYAAPLERYLRRRRWLLRLEGLTWFIVLAFAAFVICNTARTAILTLLNLTFTGTPPGCC